MRSTPQQRISTSLPLPQRLSNPAPELRGPVVPISPAATAYSVWQVILFLLFHPKHQHFVVLLVVHVVCGRHWQSSMESAQQKWCTN